MSKLSRTHLGDLLGIANTGRQPRLSITSTHSLNDIHVSDVTLDNGKRLIPGFLLVSKKGPSGPAVLYAHAHGNRHDIGAREVIDGRPALLDPPLGMALAQAGYVVLCIDMPGFGARQCEGSESALSKAGIWQGRPLIGQMVSDQIAAFEALLTLSGVDPKRIAVLGLSMGATLAYMTAAMAPRISACVHLCAYAQVGPLIATGAHDLHGPYMTIPGLLPDHDLDDVAGLVAPRPQLLCASPADPLTPPLALDPALSGLRAAYANQPAALQVVLDQDAGHKETSGFRAAVIAFLAQTIGPA